MKTIEKKNPEVLFISGSLGLGHVTRDIAIANELRERYPGMNIRWLAAHPATLMLESAGEELLPEASAYANENVFAEQSSNGASLNLLNYLLKSRNGWKQNVEVFAQVMQSYEFDLVIGDETYEIAIALRNHPELKKAPVVILYDFVGLDSMTWNPLEKLGVYIWNRKWSYNYRKKIQPPVDLGLFIGRLEDIPDRSFGFLLPNRRAFAKTMYEFVGYILPFSRNEIPDKAALRKKLGYNSKPLVVASIGGTSVGKDLLELCGKAFSYARKKIPDLQMVLVTGPRIKPDFLDVPDEIDIQPFIPRLYEHFAASDLVITQCGGTSVVELTALNKPFIYFPLEKHCEQANIADNLKRNHIGVEMKFSKTDPSLLAEKMVELYGKDVNYPNIPVDGAGRAAGLIAPLLGNNSMRKGYYDSAV
jgi:UDP-N-acetylglucosamine:LPS N-acetylglucosamine transferase